MVVVSVVVEVSPASEEASTFLEAGGVCPGGVLRSRGRLEREPGGVVCPQGNLPTLEGTILFLGATEEAAASGGALEMAGEVLLSPGEIFLLPREGFFVPDATARLGPVAAAGEDVVVVAFAVLDVTVVGGVLPVMCPLLGRGVGDNGGQEVTLLPAVDARVVLVAVVVHVVAGDVFLISDSLLSESPELLGLGFVFFIRVGASRPGTSGGDGAHPGGVLPRGLTLDLVELLSGLPPPLLRRIGEVGGHEEVRTLATDARVLLVLVLLEDVADLAVDVELLAPLLSALPEFLCEDCVVVSRVGVRQPGESEVQEAPAVGGLPVGLVRPVVVFVVVVGFLVSPHVVCANICAFGMLEAVSWHLRRPRRPRGSSVTAGRRPSDHRVDCNRGRRRET